MAQLIPGVTYQTGDTVNANNLNAHVSGARLTAGAISEQTAAGSVGISDGLLILQGGSIKQGTVTQILDNASLPSFVKKDGSVAMTGELTLSTTTPTASLSAAPKAYVDAAMPTGAIMPFYRTSAPSGWAQCDGSTIPITTETAALRALIAPATTYPDLRGEFIRGLDTGRGVDQPRTLASSQAQDVQPHSHTTNSYANSFNQAGGGGQGSGASNDARFLSGTNSYGTKETRPRNVAFLYCIKL